jgi:hypothetical protein
LRIGNKIWRPCCYDEVLEIRENGIIGLDSLRGLISYSEIEPIPITEELLLKIGFKKDVDANSLYRYAIDNCLFEIRLWDSGTLIKLDNYCEDCVRKVHLPKTPNLHQLQNAYYLVTGKELEIKL